MQIPKLINLIQIVRRPLTKGGIGSLIIKLGYTLLGLLTAVFLARILGPENYGVYSFVYALIMVLAIPAQLGLPQLLVRETSKAAAKQQWGLMRGLWRWGTMATCIFSSVIILLVYLAITVFEDKFDTAVRNTLLAALLLIPLVALGDLRDAAMRGLHKVVLGQIPGSILRPILFLAFLAISLIVTPNGFVQPHHAMSMQSLAAAISFIFGGWMLWKMRPEALIQKPHPEYQWREWLKASIPLGLIAGFQLVNYHTGIIVLGMFRPSEEAGIYKVIVTCASLVAFGLQAINLVLAPHFASLYAKRELQQLQRLVTISARAILALALPVVLIFVTYGDAFLSIVFGTEYAVGYYPLLILVIGQLVNASMGSVGLLLNMTGHERDTMRGVIMAAIVNLALSILLIPYFGIFGASAATACTVAFWHLMLWRFTHIRLGLESMAISIIRIR